MIELWNVFVQEVSISYNLSWQSPLCCSVLVTKVVFSCMSQPFLSGISVGFCTIFTFTVVELLTPVVVVSFFKSSSLCRSNKLVRTSSFAYTTDFQYNTYFPKQQGEALRSWWLFHIHLQKLSIQPYNPKECLRKKKQASFRVRCYTF